MVATRTELRLATMNPTFDVSRRPIVVFTWPAKATDTLFDELDRFFDDAVARNERFGLLCDGRAGSGITRQQAVRAAGVLRHWAPALAPIMTTAIIVEKPAQRAGLTTINLFVPPKYPQRVFSDRARGQRWLEVELGLAAPTS